MDATALNDDAPAGNIDINVTTPSYVPDEDASRTSAARDVDIHVFERHVNITAGSVIVENRNSLTATRSADRAALNGEGDVAVALMLETSRPMLYVHNIIIGIGFQLRPAKGDIDIPVTLVIYGKWRRVGCSFCCRLNVEVGRVDDDVLARALRLRALDPFFGVRHAGAHAGRLRPRASESQNEEQREGAGQRQPPPYKDEQQLRQARRALPAGPGGTELSDCRGNPAGARAYARRLRTKDRIRGSIVQL